MIALCHFELQGPEYGPRSDGVGLLLGRRNMICAALRSPRACRQLDSVCRKKTVFAGWGRPSGLAVRRNTRSIASKRHWISLEMPQSAVIRDLGHNATIMAVESKRMRRDHATRLRWEYAASHCGSSRVTEACRAHAGCDRVLPSPRNDGSPHSCGRGNASNDSLINPPMADSMPG